MIKMKEFIENETIWWQILLNAFITYRHLCILYSVKFFGCFLFRWYFTILNSTHLITRQDKSLMHSNIFKYRTALVYSTFMKEIMYCKAVKHRISRKKEELLVPTLSSCCIKGSLRENISHVGGAPLHKCVLKKYCSAAVNGAEKIRQICGIGQTVQYTVHGASLPYAAFHGTENGNARRAISVRERGAERWTHDMRVAERGVGRRLRRRRCRTAPHRVLYKLS